MTSIGSPNIVSFTRLSRAIADIKTRADTARIESVTGRREDVTAATNGDVGSAHLLKKAVEDAQAYQQHLVLAQIRAERTQNALGALGGEAVRIGTESISASGRNDLGALKALGADARAAIANIFSELNVTEGGRALFSGDASDRLPFGDPAQLISDIEAIVAGATDAADANTQLDTYFNDPAGGFLTNIYQGGTGKAAPVEIAPGVRIDVSATAADQPVKDILRNLAIIAVQDSATFADATSFVESGAENAIVADASIINLRSTIGVGEASIAAAIERHETEESVLTSLFNEKTVRDQFEAASELQLLESQLEASYLLTARLSRLRLSDYIR